MKVLLSTPLNSYTGYGNDGVSLIQALLRWGANVYVHPSSVHPPLPREAAGALTAAVPPDVDLLLSHRCPQELARPTTAGVYSRATVALAWTMWEWTTLGNVDEINQANCEHAFRVSENLEASLQSFDAVMAYDPVSAEAMAPFHPRVAQLLGGVEPRDYIERDWVFTESNPCAFLMQGQLSARKNPFEAIAAFRELRLDGDLANATLTLKDTSTALPKQMEQWCPGLSIVGEVWPAPEVEALRARSHVLLSPSWGEGKNIPLAQFAMSGGAAVSTMFGGPATYLSEQWAWPVKHDLTEWSCGSYGAKVRRESLKTVMSEIYHNPREAQRRGEVASRVLPSMLSWDAVLERLMFALPDLAPGARGAEVAALMRSCRKPASTKSADEFATAALV